MKIYIIEKLWLDPLENEFCNACGYKPIGYVKTKEKAINISKSEYVQVAECRWPLEYMKREYKDKVHVFRYRILEEFID